MALQTKEFIGSTGRPNLWTWKIIASEKSADISTKTSVIKIESYIGRQSTAGGSYFMGTATLRYRAGGETRDIWYENWTTVNVSAGGWHKIGEQTFTVSNTGTKADPTKITVSSELVGASFSPTTGSASGELTLTALHDAPTINNVTCKEKNTLLTSVGVGDDYVVDNLSIKEFTIDVDTYDGATVTKYEVINGDKIYESTTNVVRMNLQENNLTIRYDEMLKRYTADLYIRVTDNLDGVLKFAYPNTYVIPYTKPSIEKTSTSIKRKTGWSEQQQKNLKLTDNFGVLNFVGTCYKENDAVGNNNKPTVQYKIWGNNESEPSTYKPLTTPNVSNVTIKDFEIGNLIYTEPYNYKIRIYDVFFKEETTVTVKVDILPTGVSVWSEYKDRVNFIKATINGNDIVESGKNDNGSWIKYYDGTLICQGSRTFNININTAWGALYETTDMYDFGQFPIQFVDIPEGVYLTQKTGLTCFPERIQNTTNANIGSTWFTRPTTMEDEVTWSFLAIGKWK